LDREPSLTKLGVDGTADGCLPGSEMKTIRRALTVTIAIWPATLPTSSRIAAGAERG
jgi:hypothetical protein